VSNAGAWGESMVIGDLNEKQGMGRAQRTHWLNPSRT
jgi:hypothetical protein